MLGASISEDYDLTEALKRVRDVIIVYTSTHDHMLGDLMKFSGTADRKRVPGAGIHGFKLPPGATAKTQALYTAKIRTIPWSEQMKAVGDQGKHFDNVKPEFVRDYVAPYLARRASPSPSDRTHGPASSCSFAKLARTAASWASSV